MISITDCALTAENKTKTKKNKNFALSADFTPKMCKY